MCNYVSVLLESKHTFYNATFVELTENTEIGYLKLHFLCFEILLCISLEIRAHTPPLVELSHSFMSAFYFKYCQNKVCLSESLLCTSSRAILNFCAQRHQ